MWCLSLFPVVRIVGGVLLGAPMCDNSLRFMSWNVRGLNCPAKRSAINEVATAHRVAVLSLQETKIETWTTAMATEVGGQRLQGCVVLPAFETRGGTAIFWNTELVNIVSHRLGSFSITTKVEALHSRETFWMTTVYGPTDDAQKDSFLSELAAAAPPTGEQWLINGDFNMIYQARDKNNSNLNRRMMGKFRRATDLAGLKEIKCKNRRYTWSNEREDPTLCSINKFFCNIQWEDAHSDYMLAAASTSFSDRSCYNVTEQSNWECTAK